MSRRDELRDWFRFLQAETHLLLHDPAVLFARAANQPDVASPAQAAARRWQSGVERRPWLRWINKPQELSSCRLVLPGSEGGIHGCAFSADGKRIAGMDSQGTLRIWSAENGEELAALEGHPQTTCALAPDGARVARSSGPGVTFRDALTGELIFEIDDLRQPVTSVSFSPKGERLLVAEGNNLHVRDSRSGAAIATMSGHQRTITACAFSPDGTRIASGALGGGLRLWDARGGRLLAELTGHSKGIHECAFSPDGAVLASASKDKTLRLWDAHPRTVLGFRRALRREPLATCEHGGEVRSCAFSPDGARLVTGSDDVLVRIWEIATGRELAVLAGHTGIITGATWLSGGTRVLSASFDGTLRLWDAASGAALGTLHGHRREVNGFALSRDQTRIASASGDGTIRIWDPDAPAVGPAHTETIESCAIAPDGKRFAAGSRDGIATLWSAETGRVIATLRGHQHDFQGHAAGVRFEYVTACAFSPDGSLLATGASDETVRLWDGVTGAEQGTLAGRNQRIPMLAFTPDGSLLIVGYQDGRIGLRLMPGGAELALLQGHRSQIHDLAVSPDGRWLVSAAHDDGLRVWDLATAEQSNVLLGHGSGGYPESCCFSPDGILLASAAHDGTIRLWEMPGGTPQAVLEVIGNAEACDFSPDGRLLATGSAIQGARLWDVATGRFLAEVSEREEWVGVTRFSPNGAYLVSVTSQGVETTKVATRMLTLWEVSTRAPRLRLGGVASTSNLSREPVVVWSASGRRLLVGSNIGDVYMLELMNLPAEPPLVTPTVLYRIELQSYDPAPSVACGWCGKRSVVPAELLARLKGPDPVRGSCPACGEPLRFNPFVVDGRGAR